MQAETTLTTLLAIGMAAIGLGLFGFAVQGTFFGRRLLRWSFGALPALGVLAGITLSVGAGPVYWVPPLVLACAWSLVLVGRSQSFTTMRVRVLRHLARPRAQWAGLFAAGLVLTLWCVVQAEPADEPVNEAQFGLDSAIKEALAEDVSVTAVTDRGRRISLFTMPAVLPPRLAQPFLDEWISKDMGTQLLLIRTAPSSFDCNCHGWAYAGGRWWILSTSVAQIVEDNGYQPVAMPQPRDLVIYRDAVDRITHSAAVVAVENGQVLLESKWGHLGRFIHRPVDQPYGRSFSYYRSARSGHVLRGLDRGSVPVPVTRGADAAL